MIGRPAIIARFPGGSQIPSQDAIVAPGASSAVAGNPIARDHGAHEKPAMEMPALWKPQNGFHSALEISHTTRDSHIPTADHFSCLTRRRRRRGRRTTCVVTHDS